MKKIFVILIIIIFIIGCMGKDGDDGNAYLKIKLYSGVTSYWDNNPSIPYGFSESTFYHCSPGTFNYEYDLDDGTYWYGTYTLTIEHGTDGEIFWKDGDDGRDKYYTLKCYFSGPDFDVEYGYWGKDCKLNSKGVITLKNVKNNDFVEVVKKIDNYKFSLIGIKDIRKQYPSNIPKTSEQVNEMEY